MSSPRASANHALYLAGILITQWRELLAEQALPAHAVNAAFQPAVRLHLGHAYGWFLVQLAGEKSWSAAPPANCSELPPVPQGQAEPGEITEFRRLEQEGWLRDLLGTPTTAAAAPSAITPAGLAVSDVTEPGLDSAGAWKSELEKMFERMSDSLDEY